jgi:HEAT repeat protein
MFYSRSLLTWLSLTFILLSCSTSVINLTETSSLLKTSRSLDIRENEAQRVLIMDLSSLPLRDQDIARFEAILINPNTVFFIPSEPLSYQKQERLIPLGSALIPSPDQSTPNTNPSPAPTIQVETTDEARVRALERQAAIRLLSQNPDSFLLILAQLGDAFENVRLEALKVILAANASHEPEIWNILQSGLLDSTTRALLIPFFLKTGTRGVARLIILLADQDEQVRHAAADILVKVFPSPTNATLNALIHSPNPASRALAPLWLITYRSEPALRPVFTLIEDDNPLVSMTARSAYSIHQVQAWAAIPSLAYLRLSFPPTSRALIISRLISIAHPLVIPYVYELLDHSDLTLRQQSFTFAVALGNRYYNELIRLIHTSEASPLLLTQVIRIINLSENNILRQNIIPLLNHPHKEVRWEAQSVIEEHFNDFAEALNKLFDPQQTQFSNLFIAQLFLEKINPALLYDENSQNFSYHRLMFIWNNISNEIWNNFIAKLPRSRNRVEITLLYTFYQTVQRSSWLNIHHNEPLIALSTTMIQNALKIQQIEHQNPAFLTNLLKEQQNLRQQWQNAQLQANATSRNLFADYALTLQQLNDAQLGLPFNQATLANQFLASLNLSTQFLKEFTILNLPL